MFNTTSHKEHALPWPQWRPHFFRLRSNFVETIAVAILPLRYFEATVLGCDMIDESLQAFLRLQQHTNSGLNFAELHLQRHPIFDSSASTKQDPRFNPCFRELQLIVIPSLPVWAVGPLSPINNHDFANMEWSYFFLQPSVQLAAFSQTTFLLGGHLRLTNKLRNIVGDNRADSKVLWVCCSCFCFAFWGKYWMCRAHAGILIFYCFGFANNESSIVIRL